MLSPMPASQSSASITHTFALHQRPSRIASGAIRWAMATLLGLLCSPVLAATFDFTTATDNGASITSTVSGVTLTVTSSGGANIAVQSGLGGNTAGNAVVADVTGATTTSMTLSFSVPVDVASLHGGGDYSADQTTTWTFTPDVGGAVSQTVIGNFGTPVNLNLSGITQIVITSAVAIDFVIDDVVFTIANAAPTITGAPASATVTEDVATAVDLSAVTVADSNGDNITLTLGVSAGTIASTDGNGAVGGVTVGGSGTASLTLAGSAASINSYLDTTTRIQYTTASNSTTSATLTLTPNDGTVNGTAGSTTLNVTAVNDVPTLSNASGYSINYQQGQSAQRLLSAGTATVTDVDSADFSGGNLTVSVVANAAVLEDVLSFDTSGVVALAGLTAGSNVSVSGTVVGTLANNIATGTNLVVNLNANATTARVASLINAITYRNAETGTLTANTRTVRITVNDGDGGTSVNYDNSVVVTALDSDGSLTAGSGVSEPVALGTTVDTVGEAVSIFDFTLSDGGTADAIAMAVSQIVVHVSGTASDTQRSQVTWRLNGPDASNVTGSYSAGSDTITFSGLSISIANGGSETYTINAYFNNNTGLTEGLTYILSVDGDTDLTVTGTRMGTTSAVTNGTGTAISVVATSLAFTTQPAGSVSGVALTVQPVVSARDAFGNVDTDFTETVTITEGSAGTLSNNTAVAVAGVATFSGMTYTASADQQSFTLTANDQDGVGSNLATVDANTVTSDVVATRLVFSTQPVPTTLNNAVSTAFTTVPVVRAVDANGTTDTGYGTSITLSEANGAGSAALTGTSDTDGNAATVTRTPTTGTVTFTGLTATYTAAGSSNETFNLRASSGALTTADSSQITVLVDTTPPDAPSTPDLATASDTGSSNTDNITSDNTPTITGTAEANSTLVLTSSVNGTVGSTTVDGSGNWSVTTSTLSAGSHTITATATDAANNTSAASAGLSITIDTTAPAAPSAPDLSAASDTGGSSTDNITSDTTPTFTGTVEANSTVIVISSVSGTLGTTTADGSGNWSFTAGLLSETTHTITATATDAAGNVSSASSALAVVIDASVPATPAAPDLASGSDSGSSNTDNVTNDNTPTFTGTAEAGSTVTLGSSVAGTVGSATADGSGNWSITASTLSDGAHTMTITATDAAGNVSAASAGLAISIDTSSPTAPSAPDLAAGSDTGESDTDNITSDTTPTFTGTAEANSTVTVASSVAGTVGSATADGSGNWSVTATTLADGSHNITATATDSAGNVSSASAALSITVDSNAPATPSAPDLSAASDSGSSDTDNTTNDTTPTLTGSAEANSTVTLTSSLDGAVGSTSADGSGNWSITASVLAEGTHNLTVIATDNVGNSSAASAALAVTVDTTVPATATATLAVNENVADGTAVGTVTSTGASAFVLTDDAGGRFAINAASGAVTVVDGALLNFEDSASHGITVQSTDLAGNSTSTALTVTVNNVNDVPTITGTPATSVNEDSAYSFVALGADADTGDTLTYSITNMPAWASFNTNTGELSGTPANEHVGVTSNIVITVTDSASASASLPAFSLTVVNTNDAPVISGTPATAAVEGVAYSFTPTASDVDVGDNLTFVITNRPSWATFSSSTGALSGTPAFANIGTAANIVIGVSDGTTTVNLATFSIVVVGDLDGDGIGDDVDTDIDGDGMSNDFETENGLDPRDPSDAATDTDGDGASNLDEFLAGSNPNADDYAPVITPPADILVDAEGLFTAVSVGVATASDGLDGDVVATSDAPSHFSPGNHVVTWTATDAAGNVGTATQLVSVNPLVSFSKNQQVAEGASVTVQVILNGPAANWPVSVPYSVSGTAQSGIDHTLASGTLVINDPDTQGEISFSVTADGLAEDIETIILTMGEPENAVASVQSQHVISIYEDNVAPSVALSVQQNGLTTLVVGQLEGDVVVTATVQDANPGDTHTLTWQADDALEDLDMLANQYTFDASALAPGLYRIAVTANDGSATGSSELLINVIAELPVLSSIDDEDGDGIDDLTEGFGDSDQDGIADYLDAIAAPNTLQEVRAEGIRFLIETDPGLGLGLGDVALQVVKGGAGIDSSDLTAAGLSPDRYFRFDGGIVDFVVNALPVAGESVNVVIPQLAVIPADAVYRKLTAAGWQDFVEDAANRIASAAGAEGYCPPPGDSAYTAGLMQGHWCVQLTIEDGGPNDADGERNQAIVDPGGVGLALAQEVTVTGRSKGSSGGAVNLWLLGMLLVLIAAPRLRRVPLATFGLLLVGGWTLTAASPAQAWYLGTSLGQVQGSDSQGSFNRALADVQDGLQTSQFDTERDGWSLYVGGEVHERGTIEIGYLDLGEAEVRIEGALFNANQAAFIETVTRELPATGKGYTAHYAYQLYRHGNWSLQGRLGLFAWSSEQTASLGGVSESVDRDGTDLGYGLALEYAITPAVGLRLGVERYDVDDSHLDFFSLGIVTPMPDLF